MLPIYEVAAEYRGPICLIHSTADTICHNFRLHLLDERYHNLDDAARVESCHPLRNDITPRYVTF